jgi:hypothetical protein
MEYSTSIYFVLENGRTAENACLIGKYGSLGTERIINSTDIDIDKSIVCMNIKISRYFQNDRSPEIDVGTDLAELYDMIGFINCCRFIESWNGLSNHIKKNISIFIGDNSAFKEIKITYSEGINVILSCNFLNNVVKLNRAENVNGKFFFGFKDAIHDYGNGFFTCKPLTQPDGTRYSNYFSMTQEELLSYLHGKENEFSIIKLIKLFYNSRSANKRDCEFISYESIFTQISSIFEVDPKPSLTNTTSELKSSIKCRADGSFEHGPCYSEDFETFFITSLKNEKVSVESEKTFVKSKKASADEEEYDYGDPDSEYLELLNELDVKYHRGKLNDDDIELFFDNELYLLDNFWKFNIKKAIDESRIRSDWAEKKEDFDERFERATNFKKFIEKSGGKRKNKRKSVKIKRKGINTRRRI